MTSADAIPARSAVCSSVTIEVSPGELIDKITILEIKAERITDPDKLRHVQVEVAMLRASRDRSIPPSDELTALASELRSVNETLWTIEDEIRVCEQAGDFGPRFVELARSVYKTNDQRAALKRRINERLGATIVEEKSYAASSGALDSLRGPRV